VHALRHARAARLTVALAASFALLLALPTTAHAAEPVAPPAPRTTAPAAVLASISPGGQAYRTAAKTVAGEGDETLPSSQTTTLGTPRAVVDYVDGEQTGATLARAELVSESEPSDLEWLVVATKDGRPIELLRLGSDGHVVSDGAQSAERGRALEALPRDALVLVAGPPAQPAYYTVSEDRRTVTPLDDAARVASGSTPLTVAAFRANQRAVHAHWLATSPGLPEEPEQGTNVAVMLSILGAAAVGTIIWGVLTRRRRHVTPHPAT